MWGHRLLDLDRDGRGQQGALCPVCPKGRNALYYCGWDEEEVEELHCLVLLVVKRPPKGLLQPGLGFFRALTLKRKDSLRECGVTIRLMEVILSVLLMRCSKGIKNTNY